MHKTVSEVLKMWYFPYSAFWAEGQRSGGGLQPPPIPPGYTTG